MTSRIMCLAMGLFGLTMSFDTVAENAFHGLAMHGDLKYPPEITHFDYTNPDALKGGKVRLSAVGSFDSLNPYILKGRTSNTGPFDVNMRLSEQRAMAVRQHLISRGVLGDSITAKGYGPLYPIASNDTPEGRRANQRVKLLFQQEIK